MFLTRPSVRLSVRPSVRLSVTNLVNTTIEPILLQITTSVPRDKVNETVNFQGHEVKD